MGINTKIEWCDHSWSPWQGCQKTKYSGCDNCYMFKMKRRFGTDPTHIIRSADMTFNLPLKPKVNSGDRIFVCSWSDFFHPKADPTWRAEAWEIMKLCSDVTFIIPTKRPENIPAMLPNDWGEGYQNVWLGVSVSDQRSADDLIPLLFLVSAAIYFVSAEPLVKPLDLRGYLKGIEDMDGKPYLDWVIVGGESGSRARPMHPKWAQDLFNQCGNTGTPFFMKQQGEWGSTSTHKGAQFFHQFRDVEDFEANFDDKFDPKNRNVCLTYDGHVSTTKDITRTDSFFNFPIVVMRKNGKKKNDDPVTGKRCKAFPYTRSLR